MSNSSPVLGIDLTGADTPPQELFPAIEQLIQEHPQLQARIFWPKGLSLPHGLPFHHVHIFPVEDAIHMEESPVAALKAHPESAIPVGIHSLQAGTLDAFVTCGHTGALVTAAAMSRDAHPRCMALAARLPTLHAHQHYLLADCGALLDYRPDQLLQLAQQAIPFAQHVLKRSIIRVGLLNIGAEAHKGSPGLREAYALLKQDPQIAFLGNVEPAHIFAGGADLVLSGGFVGNVFLKTIEALWPGERLIGGAARLLGVEQSIFKLRGDSTATTLHRGLLEVLQLL